MTPVMQFLAVVLCTTAYAVLRYVGFGDVSPIHVPAYIVNKSVSMAAAAGLFMASAGLVRSRQETVRFWGRASRHLVLIHLLLSLALFSGGYYPKFFAGERLNLTGEAMLLFGGLAAYCFWRLGAADLRQTARRALTALSRVLVAAHLFVMGFGGWLQVRKWHGGLPPITLLSFLLVACSLIALLRVKEPGLAPTAAAAPSGPGSARPSGRAGTSAG